MHFLTLNISAQAVTTISPNFNQSRALDKIITNCIINNEFSDAT